VLEIERWPSHSFTLDVPAPLASRWVPHVRPQHVQVPEFGQQNGQRFLSAGTRAASIRPGANLRV
jgi:hypothetical protein